MRAVVEGTVSALGEPRSYQRRDGQQAHTIDVFLAAGDPRYAPDRISMDPKIAPKVGERVAYLANFDAKLSQRGSAYLSVWAIERFEVDGEGSATGRPLSAVPAS